MTSTTLQYRPTAFVRMVLAGAASHTTTAETPLIFCSFSERQTVNCRHIGMRCRAWTTRSDRTAIRGLTGYAAALRGDGNLRRQLDAASQPEHAIHVESAAWGRILAVRLG